MNKPLVTVYITNFNYDQYLREAYNSLANQTYEPIQIIIIDDGSTDNSKQIILDIQRENKEVAVIFQQNKGLNKTNNVAISASKGKYIMRLDADDILVENAIEKMVHTLENDDSIGLVFPDYYLMDTNGHQYSAHQRHNFSTEVSLYDKPAHGACTMIRVENLKKVGGYDEDFDCQDGYELWTKFIQQFNVVNINEPLFYYRKHGTNLTNNEKKILSTRARINQKVVENRNITISTLSILAVRNKEKYLYKIKGKTILERKIDTVLEAKLPQQIVVTSSSQEIKNLVETSYANVPRIKFIERPAELELKTEPLAKTIQFILLTTENTYNTLQVISPDFPFVEAYSIDDAINTMYLFDSDSLVSVREDNHMFFQHHGYGMTPIFNQNQFTKLERETLYKSIGGISVVRRSIFEEKNEIVTGKVGHLMLDEKASIEIRSQFLFDIAKALLLDD
jgi:glycosyltransferase involved in cell wall biosynthesis